MGPDRLRQVRPGELLDPEWVRGTRQRRIDAVAVIQPGRVELAEYLRALHDARDRFAAWDGRIQVLEPDGGAQARAIVVDRYGQVYAATDATDATNLPGPDALEEWFKFLATACPECGVIDDPNGRDWTP